MHNPFAYPLYAAAYYGLYVPFWIISHLLPLSLLKKLCAADFARYKIKLTDGKENAGKYDKKQHEVEMVVNNDKFYRQFITGFFLGFGETYMDGLWDCDDMFKLFVATLGRMKPSDIKNPFVSLKEHMLLSTNRQTRIKSHQTIDLHYNLGNDLYANMLDERMVYSCAYWKDVKDDQDLDQAQFNKLDLVARKLHLKPGMKVLDIGCGWGSAAKFMAEKYKVNVVGYSLSQEQIDYARESCKGLDNVEFHCEDYRNARGKFDRIFSIGFLEHVGVKNYRTYFEVVERCLEDDGIHLVHTITSRDHSMLKTEGFLDKYIFPNGELPYVEEPLIHSEGLLVLEDLHNFGPSYTKTLLAWQKRFTKNWPKLEEEFGPKAGGKFHRMWNYYLFVCAALFETRLLNVCQYVQTKKGMRGGYDSVR